MHEKLKQMLPADILASIPDPVLDDAIFLYALANLMEEGDSFQFPDDPWCQKVTDGVVEHLRAVADRLLGKTDGMTTEEANCRINDMMSGPGPAPRAKLPWTGKTGK
jgi:hypothetical protein